MPDLLAEEQAGGDAERQRREQRAGPKPAERDAGIGEAEQRHDQEGDPGRERVLEPVQRRVGASGAPGV